MSNINKKLFINLKMQLTDIKHIKSEIKDENIEPDIKKEEEPTIQKEPTVIKKKGRKDFENWLNGEYDKEFKAISTTNNNFKYSTSLTESDVNNWEALQKAIKEMGLRETSCRGVYCEVHNPNMPAGNYTHQRHYVWNDATHEMVELPDIYFLSNDVHEAQDLEGYDEILAYRQGYKFTDIDGVYGKDGKNHKLNLETKTFEELTDVDNSETDSAKNSMLDDPLYVHGQLEPYRDTLYNICPNYDIHNEIMNSLETELIRYYNENGEQGLSEYLNNYFEELIAQYNLSSDPDINNTDEYKFESYLLYELKPSLLSEYEYSESYADTVISFIREKTDFASESFNIDDARQNAENILNQLTSKTSLEGYDYNHEQHTYKMVSLFTDEYTSLSVQNEFFAYMINNAVDFKNDNDRLVFLKRVFTDAGEKIGKWTKTYLHSYTLHENDTHMKVSDLHMLDENGDDSWFNEFYEIINSEAVKLNQTSNYANAAEIDLNVLFGESGVLKAEDISQRLDDMLFSEDAGVVKLRSMLYQAFERFNIDNYYDETEIITDVIKMLNNRAGQNNCKELSIETFDQLNDGTIFELLEEIINSDELRERYYFDVDDELDVYSEARESGACWAIAAFTSLSNTEIGKQMIKDAMTFNDDGSVTVTFKGALDGNGNPRSYTITREEMENAKNNNDGVSYGDNTMFVLLLATEKLRKDLGILGIAEQSSLSPDDPGYGIYGGWSVQMTEWLTGKDEFLVLTKDISRSDINKLYNNSDEKIKAYLNYIMAKNNVDAVKCLEDLLFSQSDISKSGIFYTLKDGLISGDVMLHLSTRQGACSMPIYPDGEMQNFGGGHAWGVKNITEETVTFWDLYRQTEYTVSIDDLLNSGFFISYTVLNDEYELPYGYRSKDYEIYSLEKRLNELCEQIILNAQYDKTIIDSNLYSYEITIGCEETDRIYNILANKNNKRSTGNYFALEFSLTDRTRYLLNGIINAMPNYTDYSALMYAYNNVLSSNVSKAIDLVRTSVDENMPFEYIIEKLEESLSTENIINQFLSLLPDGPSQ